LNVGELSLNTNDGILYFLQQATIGNAVANSIIAIGPVPPTANALTNAVTIALSGDASGSVSFNGANNVTIATTLATVNSNVGTFGTTTVVPTISVNGKGLVTSISNSAIAFPVTSVFGRTGAVTLQSSDVTGALGYTPIGTLVASGDVSGTSVGNAITLTLANVATAGTFASVVINSKGLVTSGLSMTFSGDASGVSVGNATTLTLATVNSNVGTYGSSVAVPVFSVNAKGLVTSVANSSIAFPVTSVFGRTGAVTLQSSDVTGALGYTPIGTLVASGDVSGTSSGNTITLTLATVNANVGTFNTITVNSKGLVTSASNTSYVNTNQLGVANGVATLNSSGQLTASQLPSAITGALVYQGTWNAATNTPTLTSGTGTKGYYYKVSVAGGTNLDGLNTWYVGDTAVFDGTTWDKIDGIANEVVSVNGFTGNVVLTVSNISGAAPLASPAFTGTPTAPTPSLTDNSTDIATTAYVKGQNYVQGPILASGDASGTSVGNAITLTLATVNSTVGTFGTATIVPTFTVNAKGLVTSVANTAIAFPVTSVFGRTGAVTLLSSDVTGALGYTPIGTLVASGDVSGTSSGNTITLTLATVATAGTFSAVVINSKGLVTSGTSMTFTGDASGISVGNAVALTLATVNSNVGTYGGNTSVATVTVNAKGLVTAVSNTAIAFPVTSVFGRTGAVTLTSSDVTGALGYIPVNNAVVGVANGIATLNSSGQLTASQVPSSVLYGSIVASGDASGTSVGNTITLTLATVNSNVGTFGTTTTVPTITVNGKGLVTAVSNSAIAFPVTSVFGRTGAVVLQSSEVTTALGYTPIGTLVASGDASGTSVGNAITLTLATVATAGTYGAVVVNAKGLVTSGVATTLTGDATGSSTGASIPVTLATVNSLGNAVGTYVGLTINGKGLVTNAVNVVTFAGYNLGVGLGPDIIDGGSF